MAVDLNFATDWKYAPAPESPSSAKINPKYDLFIGGKFVPAAKGKYFDTVNPSNEKKLAEVADAGAEDVDKAVRAARSAMPSEMTTSVESGRCGPWGSVDPIGRISTHSSRGSRSTSSHVQSENLSGSSRIGSRIARLLAPRQDAQVRQYRAR